MTDTNSQTNTPFRINLEQQKKRAKELLKAYKKNPSSVVERFEKFHPNFLQQVKSVNKIQLSDAQWVIARELGLASWPKLKQHIALMLKANEDIASETVALDAKLTTLHIRCGTDIQSALSKAGFAGDFLDYSDPVCQGPVNSDGDLKQNRINFLHQAYGSLFNLSLSKIKNDYEQAQSKLEDATHSYQRIVLWFEHDSYDQLILARLLAHFAKVLQHQLQPPQIELISINNFPGSIRFTGLGQLPADAIRLLWSERCSVTSEQLAAGKTIWQSLGMSSPMALMQAIVSKQVESLNNMSNAVYRHLQELPAIDNGLSLTEQLTLEILNQQSLSAGQLFNKLTHEKEPLPWLGDVMYWYIVNSMLLVQQAVINVASTDLNKPWPQRQLSITPLGKDVLAGKLDWLALNPPQRWLGGINIEGSTGWRWDRVSEQPVLI